MEQHVTEPKTRSRRAVFFGSLASATAVAAIVWVILSRPFGGAPVEPSSEPLVFPEILGHEAVILNDDANRGYWSESPGEPQPRIQMWRDAYDGIGMRVTTITSIADWRDQLLVLPHSFCL